MPEEYIGLKFKAEKVEGTLSENKKAAEIVKWCKELVKLTIAPSYGQGTSGNLSIRNRDGFIITPTATFFEDIEEEDIVEIINVDLNNNIVKYRGNKLPSSETLMHAVLYGKLKNINAIFHVHDDKVMKNYKVLKIPITEKELPYGTKEVGEALLKIAKEGNYLIMNGHGCVVLGKCPEDAGKLVVEMHNKSMH